ncbi:hypothetical protein EUGRSUZ_E02953 [Eucalyptus grandis]|nr:hypothetical protein EUGRSUZ_E02953 [Eucalyptus grandis]
MNCTLHRLLLSSATLALIAFHVAASLSAYPVVLGANTGECSVPASENLVPVRREVYGNGRIIDITHRLTSDLPSYESMGSLGQFLWLAFSMKNGSLTNNSEMKLPAHTGTHVDAPGHVYDHYYEAGFDVDTLDLEVLNATNRSLWTRLHFASTKRAQLSPTSSFLKKANTMSGRNRCIPLLLLLSSIYALAAASLDAYPSVPGLDAGGCSVPTGEKNENLLLMRVFGNGRIIDITHRITPDLPAFDSEESLGQFLWLLLSMKNGSIANFSEIKLSAHTGTHVDAPGHVFDHYYDAGFDVDSLDLEILNGPALLVDVPKDKNLTAEVMESLHIPKGVRRVLFRTLNTDR